MRVAVVGSGNIGSALAKIWVEAGHEVWLSYSRDPAKLQTCAEEAAAEPATVADAFADADVVFVTVPWARAFDALTRWSPRCPSRAGRPLSAVCGGSRIDVGHPGSPRWTRPTS